MKKRTRENHLKIVLITELKEIQDGGLHSFKGDRLLIEEHLYT